MKLYEILHLKPLFDSLREQKLPIKTVYKMKKIEEILDKEIEFYQTEFAKIIQDFGKKGEDGNFIFSEDQASIAIIDGKEEECQKAVTELQLIEVMLPEIKFSLEELDGLSLDLNDMGILMSFIEE